MSTTSYNIKHKGIRLISSKTAWIKGKNGKYRLNPDYHIIGRMDIQVPTLLITASDKNKPTFKGSTHDLNNTAKGQIVEYFFNDKGKRNKKTVAYFGISKKPKNE